MQEKELNSKWENYHFMVRRGIVLGHEISRRGIEVDKAKIEVIAKLPPPNALRISNLFLGMLGSTDGLLMTLTKSLDS